MLFTLYICQHLYVVNIEDLHHKHVYVSRKVWVQTYARPYYRVFSNYYSIIEKGLHVAPQTPGTYM